MVLWRGFSGDGSLDMVLWIWFSGDGSQQMVGSWAVVTTLTLKKDKNQEAGVL